MKYGLNVVLIVVKKNSIKFDCSVTFELLESRLGHMIGQYLRRTSIAHRGTLQRTIFEFKKPVRQTKIIRDYYLLDMLRKNIKKDEIKECISIFFHIIHDYKIKTPLILQNLRECFEYNLIIESN